MKREVCMFGPCRKITFSYSYIFPSNVAGKLNFQKKGQVLRKLYKYKTFMEYQWIMQRIFIDLVWSLRCSVNRFTHLSLPVVYGENAFWAAGFFFFSVSSSFNKSTGKPGNLENVWLFVLCVNFWKVMVSLLNTFFHVCVCVSLHLAAFCFYDTNQSKPALRYCHEIIVEV